MKSRYQQKSLEQRTIALEEIEKLFKEARRTKEPELADRYVEIARKIAMKLKVRMPRELKRQFCKRCHTYLRPGVTSRVRLQKGKVIYTCLRCKNMMRFVIQ